MASRARKSQATSDRESSQLMLVSHQNTDLLLMNQQLRAKVEELQAEILRVQALLRITQVKLAQHDRRQRIEGTPRGMSFRDRFNRYAAATGARSATPTEIMAWEKENGHA